MTVGAFVLPLKFQDGSHPALDLISDGVSGALFLIAGVIADWRRPANIVGRLMILVGLAWYLEDLQFSSIPWLFITGVILSHASTALSVQLVLSLPFGRLGSTGARLLVMCGYLVSIAWPAVGIFFFNPSSRRQITTPNPLLVFENSSFVDLVDRVMELGGTVVAVGVFAVLLRRWLRASPAWRWVMLPVFVTGLLGATATISGGIWGDQSILSQASLVLYRVAFCLLPLGFLAGVARVRVGRTRVDALLQRLGTNHDGSPVMLQQILADGLGDPSLVLGVWDRRTGTYANADARPRLTSPERMTTYVAFGDRPLAVFHHDPALAEDRARLDAVTSAAAFALDRQRLANEVSEQVNASRQRAVEAADRQRYEIGTALHSGAQMYLAVAVGWLRHLEHSTSAEPAGPDPLAKAMKALAEGIEAMRDLAHDLDPVSLRSGGIPAAVESLAADVPNSLHLESPRDLGRFPAVIETTAYLAIKEAVTNAVKHSHAKLLLVTVAYNPPLLEVAIRDDGVGGAGIQVSGGLLDLQDRVLALGGTLWVDSPVGTGTTVIASLPTRPAEDDHVER
jgi:signal transduction histidine kinase